jgi:hypothetical protein
VGFLLAFGVVACRDATPPDVGGPTVAALASATPSAAPPVGDPPDSRDSSGSPASPASPDSTDEQAPAELRIPALKLDATVAAVGVNAAGEFDVPPSVDRVGWYKFGPGVNATAGSIVIAGHVDSATQGKGAFFRLGVLNRGDSVFLDKREFRVVARERYAKTTIPLDTYFARDGAPRLTLITCGGPFDPKTRHYQDNVVVTATPV